MRSIHCQVTSGGSFGAGPLLQTIGLGEAEEIVGLEVRWPRGGTAQRFGDVDLGTWLRIIERDPEAEVRRPASTEWLR